MSSSSVLLDATGRRRSPAAMPGHNAGRPPRNKGVRYPADPPTVEEIVAVMRKIPLDRHGLRLRAMIVVLWRGGLRIQEALDLDRVRSRRPARLDPGASREGQQAARSRDGPVGLERPPGPVGRVSHGSCRSGRCSASSTALPAGAPGRRPPSAGLLRKLAARLVFVAGSRRISSGMLRLSSSPVRGCRSTSSSASSAIRTWGPPARTCRGSIRARSSMPSISRRAPMMPASAALEL